MKTSSLSAIRYLLCCLCLTFIYIVEVSGQDYSSRQLSGQVSGGYQTKYLVYTPFGYPQAGTEYPLLISLHGGSAIGDDLNELTNTPHQTPAMLISNDRWYDLPFIVVSPQLKRDLSYPNYNDQNWPPELIDELIDHIVATYNIDENRIYLTGISLGGAGSWNYAAAHPERVAAIVPISGKTPVGEACKFKDIPVWAFHGSNDGLVPPSWSEQMVSAIKNCSGKIYQPKLNLLHSMEHEGWNQVYDLSNGYDVFSWMAKFSKGNNSNHSPVVSTGIDREVLFRSGPMYVTSEYFDSDGSGSISNVLWTKVSGPAISLDNTNQQTLKIVTPVTGTFVFQLAVTDAGGLTTTDQVQLKISNPAPSPAVTGLTLTSGDGSVVYGTLADDQVFNLTTLGTDEFNVRATVSGTTNFVRFSVNSDQNTRTHIASSNQYLKDASKEWIVVPGTYLVCGVAGTIVSGVRHEGTSLCHRITFTDEPVGVVKYYSVGSSNIAQTSSWKSNRDGTGSSPANFTAPNQWFYVQNTVNLTSPLTIAGTDSRLTVEGGGRINVSDGLTASLYVLDGATMNINTSASVSAPLFVGGSSTYIYGDAISLIPSFGTAVPFGNLVINSTTNSVKKLATGQTHVRGDITVQSTVTLEKNANSTELYVKGNAYFNGPSATTNCFTLRCNGYGNQYIYLNGGTTYAFRNFSVESEVGGGTLAHFSSQNPVTIRIMTTTTTGLLVKSKGVLYLNGNTLSLEAGGLNSGGETGQIHMENSALIVSISGGSAALNLRPHPDGNNLKSLEITATGGHANGLAVLDDLSITEKLKLTGGTLTTNSNLTLVSTASSTAYVARVTGTPTISGPIKIERSIPSGTLYRYLSFPVSGANVANLITHIPVTGPFTGASPNGSASSLYYYNEASATDWVPYPSSGGTAAGSALMLGRGYSTYIWNGSNPEHITLSGTLHTGDFNYAVTPGTNLLPSNPTSAPNLGWTLLGNPYACPIQWSAPGAGSATWDGTNISNTVYVRAQDNGADKFRFFNGTSGNFTGIIASGQSVWVRSIGASPTLTVKEAAKVEQTNVQFYRTGSSEAGVLHVNLRQNDLDDDAFIELNATGAPKFDPQRDAVKMKNSFFNVSVLSSDSVETAIKNLCDTLCSQEVMLAIETKAPGNYTLSAEGTAFDQISELYIVDTYTHATTKLEEGDDFTFEVTSDVNSSNAKRFRLLIDKNSSPRPVISYHNGFLISSVAGHLQWMLNGEIIPGATSVQWVPDVDGEYTVLSTHKGCSKISAPFSFRITEAENPLTSEIKVYPNPAVNVLHVSGLTGENQYIISSVSGASMERGIVTPMDNGEGTIRFKSLSPGFYLLSLKHERGEHQFKFSVR